MVVSMLRSSKNHHTAEMGLSSPCCALPWKCKWAKCLQIHNETKNNAVGFASRRVRKRPGESKCLNVCKAGLSISLQCFITIIREKGACDHHDERRIRKLHL